MKEFAFMWRVAFLFGGIVRDLGIEFCLGACVGYFPKRGEAIGRREI